MAGMKRFVTYIYAYEDKKKGNNIGFAKIEIRGEDCRIEIHLRGIYVRQFACRVYLFQEEAGDIVGHPLGEMKILNGNGDFAVRIKAGKIGESVFGINDMDGIFILSEDEQIFMSRWKEGVASEVTIERFRVWQNAESKETDSQEVQVSESQYFTQQNIPVMHAPTRQAPAKEAEQPATQDASITEQERATGQQQAPKTEPERATEQQQAPKTEPERATGQQQAPKTEPERATGQTATEQQRHIEEQENLHATEIPMRNLFPTYDWQAIWEALKQSHTVYTPFADRKAMCIQIELKDLRELPKRYWYLGNNSFLLHGFFNYQYLVLGRTGEGRWFVGVPGIYQRQERVMAAIFGFPEFIEMWTEEATAENSEPVNHMGCWYRYIEE